MLYKDFLVRTGNPLNEEEENRKAERKRERKKRSKPAEDDASDSDDEDEPELAKWEQEWWRKPDAPIVI